MRVLVFDDSEIHRAAAHAQLKGHDLTVVGTYDEAQDLLMPKLDREKLDAALESRFGDFKPYRSDDEAKKSEYYAAQKVAKEQATTFPNYDVVLSDLLVPASDQQQSSMELVGKEMPLGIFIGLLAVVRARVKYVAILTDSNHHQHPASACLDVFQGAFMVESSKVLLSNSDRWVNHFDPQDLSKALEYKDHSERWSDTIRAKNWAALLAHLISH